MPAMLPERPTLAGDWQDDDGQVISDLLEPQSEPLPPPVDVLVDPITQRPPRPGRLLTGTLYVDPAWSGAGLVLPVDTNRQNVVLVNNSATATDAVRLADDPGKLAAVPMAGTLLPGIPLRLECYTGALWASATGAAGLVPISWWAVTS